MAAKKRISFLTPPYDIIRSAYGSRSRINYGNLPPLGILYLVGELRRHGFEAQLVDASSRPMRLEEIAEQVEAFKPDVLGVSTMTPSAPSAYEMIRHLKARLDLPVVLGGVHVNSRGAGVLSEIPEVDIAAIGEGEKTIVELMRALGGELKLEDVKGLAYRDGKGGVVTTQPRPLAMNLDELAFPARDILDNSLYRLLPLSFKREPVTSMVTSRGCPYGKCSYCFQAGNKAFKYRRHSPEYVVREIEETIIPNGIREISFWDDYFLINDSWLERFFSLVEKYDLVWSCYGYPRTARKEWLAKARKAGCWAILYGFESGDQALLDTVSKGLTLEDSRRAARLTHEAGIATRASYMLALPGETPELARKTVDFAIELDCTLAQFLPLFPEEGTRMYDLAAQKGQISPFNSRTKATYVPEGYKDGAEVEAMIREAYVRYYLRWGFFVKHLRRIRTWEDVKQYWYALLFFIGLLRK